jgi:MoaA/NifB/PqqE/SkfB family radical SAM enzyme
MISLARKMSAAKRLATEVSSGLGSFRETTADPERRAAHARAWELVPERHRVGHQWLGTQATPCMATYNVYEKCDFSCTACYLTNVANQTPPLPFDEVREQLDAIRAYAGPRAKTQITAGEVTLLPVEELTRIVAYATRDAGLDPMVMTHGQTFDRDPSYLETLMVEGGLQKISVHMDTTQRGRDGQSKDWSEHDVTAHVRERFAALIRDTRHKTGLPLHAASTYTVTEHNIDDVPHVMSWFADNCDAFRMISFQPTADVGRTRENEHVQKRDLLWAKIGEGLGLDDVNDHTFLMGHPSCNQTALMWVIHFDGERQIMEVSRKNKAYDQRFMDALMRGAFRGFTADGCTTAEAIGRGLGMFRDSPQYLWQVPAYMAYRLFGDRAWVPRFVKAVVAGRPWSIRPMIVVAHNFMSSHELDTDEGQARLAACAFRLPVDGRMVPMCEMNGTALRRDKNLEATERLLRLSRRRAA